MSALSSARSVSTQCNHPVEFRVPALPDRGRWDDRFFRAHTRSADGLERFDVIYSRRMSVLQWAELDLGGTAELIRGGVAGVSVNNSPYVVSPSLSLIHI